MKLFNLLKTFISDERGIIVSMSVAMIPVILLFLAFGLDYGRAFLLKHQLQGACDAASLAGASETELHLVFDGSGNYIGDTPVINRQLADAEADAVFESNISLTHLTSQGVTIVSKDMKALDDTHYSVQVYADIQTYISGPMMAMWTNDPSLKVTRVKRLAVAKVRL